MANKQIKVVDSLAELRALSKLSDQDIARVMDGTDGYDEYIYAPASTDADDSEGVIKPDIKLTTQAGRWIQIG